MTTATTILEKATELGGNAADAYFDEFERSPTDDGSEKVGDWDSHAWRNAWHELKDGGATDADRDICLAAWRKGFWGD